MKILLGNDTVQMFGGAEQYLFDLKRLLEREGHSVELFGRERLGNPTSFLTRFYDPLSYFRLLRKIDEFQPDIVHFQGISRSISPSVLHAAKRRGVPVVQTVHDFHIVCPKTWFIYKDGKPCPYGLGRRCLTTGCAASPYNLVKTFKVLLHRRLIRNNLNLMIAPSEVLAGWLKTNLGFRDVRVIPNFIYRSPEPGPVRDTKEILFIGRLTPEKGAKYLVEAMPEVTGRAGGAHLYIVGEGPEKESLAELARRLGVEDSITFTGWLSHEEMDRYIDSAQVFCAPSVWMENCPLVLLEVISRQRPIVGSNIGGVPEIVKDGENGYLFEPGNPSDLADKVVAVLADFDLTKEMARKAGLLAEKYAPEHHYRELMEVYRELVGT